MSSPHRTKSVGAVNRMTARWIRTCPDESSVFAAPAAWPLLALLADAAAGPARSELEDAVGLPAADSRAAALETLGMLREMPAVRSALGIWVGERFPLTPEWTSGLPLGTVGLLTGDPAVDIPLLDGWARQHTDGLVHEMPVGVTSETLTVLAGAMLVRTRWARPFTGWTHPLRFAGGPWSELRAHPLTRVTRILDRLNVAPTDHGEITCLEVLGQDGVTVHLVIGEEGRTASEVLQGGLVARKGVGRKGGSLRVGDEAPGLTVESVPADVPDERLQILVPRFRVEAGHDLLGQPDVFGLKTASDATRGHFPAMGPEPSAVSAAKQRAAAAFTAEGFETAAVTGVGRRGAGRRRVPPHRARQVRAEFDRPFGYFASHRATGLILAAGWVAEPEPYTPGPDEVGIEELLRRWSAQTES